MQASHIPISVRDETSSLETVILGIGSSPGPPRGIDTKAEDSIAKGTYPTEQDIIQALNSFESVLRANKVTVLHPDNINDLNQVFVRDLGFVIDDRFIRSKMALPIREQEQSGIENIVKRIRGTVIDPPEGIIVEGGDIALYREYIFVGVGKRTNSNAVDFLRGLFPSKSVIRFDLVDSSDPALAALHLDCVFAPVGDKHALLFPKGFQRRPDEIYDIFGTGSIMAFEHNELSQLYCNIFSVSKSLVMSCPTFSSLNKLLGEIGISVSTVAYEKVGQMGGLLRCSTLPLLRSTS